MIAQLLYLDHDNPQRDITLYINSPGGSLTAMTAIYDTMRYTVADVWTACLGQAGSAAAVLLAAGTPGKRMMLPNARLVIHQPALPAAHGQTGDLEIQARQVLRARAVVEEILSRHTGQTRDRIRTDIDRETVLTAPDALGYGFVDAILPVRKQRLPIPVA